MPTLTWVGKDKVVNHHQDVPFKVLRPESHFDAPEGSPVNSTGNRIIHGDNLEALKSLLPEFEGINWTVNIQYSEKTVQNQPRNPLISKYVVIIMFFVEYLTILVLDIF